MKFVIINVILLISLATSKAQDPVDTGISFKTTTYDFGLIKKGTVTEHIFNFVNKSKTPLVITNIRSYCNCVTTNWTKEPVKQNGSGEIVIRYYAKTIGTFNKTVKVFTNISKEPIGLTVRGKSH